MLSRIETERLLANLPEEQREIIVLFYLQERSIEDVAAMLDLPEGTVKSHLHRARKAMAANDGGETMTCQAAQELILESLDGRIDEEQQTRLESHIAQCDMCRSFQEAQRVLDGALAGHYVAPQLSAAFRSKLARKIRAREETRSSGMDTGRAPSGRRNCGHRSLFPLAAGFTNCGFDCRSYPDVWELCPADDLSLLAGRFGRVIGCHRTVA